MERTPAPWQQSYFVDNATLTKFQRSLAMMDEDNIVRGPGVIGSQSCNQVARVTNPADRALIIAAPELLEALKLMCAEYRVLVSREYSDNPDNDAPMIIARAAIAKATQST